MKSVQKKHMAKFCHTIGRGARGLRPASVTVRLYQLIDMSQLLIMSITKSARDTLLLPAIDLYLLVLSNERTRVNSKDTMESLRSFWLKLVEPRRRIDIDEILSLDQPASVDYIETFCPEGKHRLRISIGNLYQVLIVSPVTQITVSLKPEYRYIQERYLVVLQQVLCQYYVVVSP